MTWSHFKDKVHVEPTLYADDQAFANALTTTWNKGTDDSLAVYALRTAERPTAQWMRMVQGDFEFELKEFVPPDLFFFFCDKATATELRTTKADYKVDAVEAVPAEVKMLKELRELQELAKTSGAEQPAVAIELSPGSKANEQESQKLAQFWESAIHQNQPQSQAKFQSRATDLITLTGVKGTEMVEALGIVMGQPEALALDILPNFFGEPNATGEPTEISRRLKGLGRMLNKEANEIVQSGTAGQTPLAAAGLRGQGEIIGIADSGLDDKSCFFNNNDLLQRDAEADPSLRKVIEYVAFADGIAGEARDHGTHVAGSVAGSCTVENGKIYNGIAQDAKIHFFDIGLAGQASLRVPGNLATGLFPDAKAAGAAIHTNSWGANINRYTTSARDVDRYSYDNEEFVILVAAGNSGPTGGSLGSPATAKNCISVGASVNSFGSIDDVADFSSRGPTADGRIKPDIVAPGHSVDSAASERACAVVPMSGTSMATPVTAGSVALVRQYFREGWYPSGVKNADDGFIPSGALLKAMVIHSGQKMDSAGAGAFPGDVQGFGRVDLDSVLKIGTANPSRGTLYVRSTKVGTEQKAELAQGTAFAKVFTLTGDGKIKATLVWMDPASAINANTNLVNDLDLTVDCGGTIEYPNRGTGRDTLNNVEMIEIDATTGSTCTVTVTATIIRQGATQPYALVVTGPYTVSEESTVTVTGAPPTTNTITTTTAPVAVPDFIKINAATCGDTCTCESMGMAPILDRPTCQQAAAALELQDVEARKVRGAPRPEGCYYVKDRLYLAYNLANKGRGVQGQREPLCKPAGTYFEIITSGTCADKNMLPINDLELCGTAALDLGLADTTPYESNSQNRPEGCYIRDRIPGFSLFLSTNEANVGNGATTKRNQICQMAAGLQSIGSGSGTTDPGQGIAAGEASRFSSLLWVMIGAIVMSLLQ